MPFPRVMRSGLSDFWNSSEPMSEASPTVDFTELGISMPTRDFPGIGASIRRGWRQAQARDHFAIRVFVKFLRLRPALRHICVTDGPIDTSSISTSIPKFCKVLFIMFAFAFISPLTILPLSSSSKDSGGGT